MQPDFDKSAAAMVAGTNKAIANAIAPLLKRIETLEARQPEKGEKGEPGERGEPGQSGVGVRDAFRQEGGVLILTLSDGTVRDLGPIVGEKGLDGKDGRDGMDGANGTDGRDGFSFEDFDVKAGDDGRTVIMSFSKDNVTDEYELKFPLPQYRQVFKQGEEYGPGDLVTWGGSLWHCNEKTTDKPDAGPWSLAVKKGRDGKDAK